MRLISFIFVILPFTVISEDSALDQPFSDSFTKLNHAPCVSLYHRNGRIGCGTESRSLQTGQLQYFDGSLPDTDDPYVAVMKDYLLTAQSLDTLVAATSNGLLQGVLVLNSTSDSNSNDQVFRSPDSQTPRGYNTPSQYLNYGYSSYAWNSRGEDLLLLDLYGLPMAYVLESDVSQSLRQQAKTQQTEASIVAEFNYYMGPDGITSKDCLEWKDEATGEWYPKCLPLGGTSVWATAGSPPVKSRNNNNQKSVIMLAAGMDSTTMFHEATPAANSAASNILALIMAAKLIGENVDDSTLDGLYKRIGFAFFQGETYGFVGSRAFLRDVAYPGFVCNSSPVYSVSRQEDKSNFACLDPLRPSLNFANLGSISGMISVDQVGRAVANGLLYVHADENNDQIGAFLANVLQATGTSSISVASSSAENGENGYPYPPSPLTSLLSLSGGSVGGAVLTGYDYAYSSKPPYHSHLDSASKYTISKKSIAAAATILARSAVAAAYDNGEYDSDTASSYASNLIPELSSNDETILELYDCLFYNGACDLLKNYANVELTNERIHTGLNLGLHGELGTPPNYYVGVYNGYYGQPFVQVGENVYGAYDGDKYGNKKSDAFGIQPRMLESALHGLLNDYLGRGSSSSSNSDSESDSDLPKCKKVSDCADVKYCSSYGDSATCTGGGVCVCKRANYHIALDESLRAVKNKPTGYFEISSNDDAISAIYTEPFWSPSVGVRVYRDAGSLAGFLALAAGLGVGALSLFSAFVLKVGLKKEKLY